MLISVERDIEQRLEALGATDKTRKSALVRRALLELLEDLEDLKVAEERYTLDEPEYSQEEVERLLGLENEL